MFVKSGSVVDPVVGRWSVVGGCSVGSECSTDGKINAVVVVVRRAVKSVTLLEIPPDVAKVSTNVPEPSVDG